MIILYFTIAFLQLTHTNKRRRYNSDCLLFISVMFIELYNVLMKHVFTRRRCTHAFGIHTIRFGGVVGGQSDKQNRQTD